MAHLDNSTTSSARETPMEWVPLARDITTMVSDWSGRDDLLAYVGNNATQGQAPALFNPYIGEVEVSIKEAFGDIRPAEVANLHKRDVQFDWPKATGLIFHEAMHAKFTTWDIKDASNVLSHEENEALHYLEESRIEHMGVVHFPNNRQFLRASSMGLIVDEASPEYLQKMTTVEAAGTLAALVSARVDAGVLDAKDVTTIVAHINTTLGPVLIEKLTNIWREFQGIARAKTSLNRMYALAKEWAALLKEESKARGEDQAMGSDALGELMDALGGALGRVERAAAKAANNQRTAERWEEERKAEEKLTSESNENKNQAAKTFASSRTGDSGNSKSVVVKERQPTPAEHSAAILIGQELEKAKYRDRDKTDFSSHLPPGRMRSNAMLQNAAYASKNLPRTALPFRRTSRRQTDEPTLTIGMMTDVSGSQSAAMEPVAVANWVFSEASRRIGARIGSVYFGGSVIAGLNPGRHLEKIVIRKAADNYEAFDAGFRALDGGLNLLNGTGARLLVVCSDGDYKSQEPERAAHWLKRCEQEGVGVLWLVFPGTWGWLGATSLCENSAAELHTVEGSTTDASYQIGATAARALTQAGAGR